jgi:ectoine hydroxylase-related dioxygenase (phytanoyl-CoA dioxygenase family)
MVSQGSRRQRLHDDGFIVLDKVLDTSQLAELRSRVATLFDEEGESAGIEFKQESGARRLANLVNKGQLFQQIVSHAAVLPCIEDVLGPSYKLSSANARSVNPRSLTPQPLHCDMGAVPDELGFWVCNAVWMLDDFTEENGALRAVPGSHRWGKLPSDELTDLTAPHPDEVLLTGEAGTVLVMNAHMWHGGTGNATDRPRCAVHAFYCRRDKPQQQYQKQLLDDEVTDSLSSDMRHLLAIDDPANDRLSQEDRPRSGFLK